MTGRFIASGNGLSRLEDLEVAWTDRLEDARVVLAKGRSATAVASGLYALEILLKVLICRRLDIDCLPRDFEIHYLAGLLTRSGMTSEITKRLDVYESWSEILSVSSRLNQFRCQPDARFSKLQAIEFFKRLEDPERGVIPWLSIPR
jgi:hypothetical protein